MVNVCCVPIYKPAFKPVKSSEKISMVCFSKVEIKDKWYKAIPTKN